MAGVSRRLGGHRFGPRLALPFVAGVLLTVAIIVFAPVLVLAEGSGQNAAAAQAAPQCGLPGNGVSNAPPENLLAIYEQAANRFELGPRGWAVLAAINRIETDFGRNVHTSSAGAIGWMQFMPATWARYKIDADGGGADPNNPADAIHSAAHYLAALLRDSGGDWRAAVFGYNHADWYVDDVLTHADGYQGTCSALVYPGAPPAGTKARLLSDGTAQAPPGAPQAVSDLIAAANRIANKPYKWGGGHGAWTDDGYDCSGATSYVLHAIGMLDHPLTSGRFMTWGDSGVGDWVTIYASAGPDTGHVFMVIAGLRFDTGGSDRVGSLWRDDVRSVSGFAIQHPPGL